MLIYFSAETLGFYEEATHGKSLPNDVVEITAAKRRKLQAGHQEGRHIAADKSGQPINLPKYKPTLNELKARKRDAVNSATETSIISGFSSDALGEVHDYQYGPHDQVNLLGLVAANSVGILKCANGAGVSEYRSHTTKQLKVVFTDSQKAKIGRLQKADALKTAIEAASKASELDAVTIEF